MLFQTVLPQSYTHPQLEPWTLHLELQVLYGFVVTLGSCRHLYSLEQWWTIEHCLVIVQGLRWRRLWGALCSSSREIMKCNSSGLEACWTILLKYKLIGERPCQGQAWGLARLRQEQWSKNSPQRGHILTANKQPNLGWKSFHQHCSHG
jgi:hypothetical protein